MTVVYKVMSLQIRVIHNDNIYLDIPEASLFPDGQAGAHGGGLEPLHLLSPTAQKSNTCMMW
jgi:hypothetical protein